MWSLCLNICDLPILQWDKHKIIILSLLPPAPLFHANPLFYALLYPQKKRIASADSEVRGHDHPLKISVTSWFNLSRGPCVPQKNHRILSGRSYQFFVAIGSDWQLLSFLSNIMRCLQFHHDGHLIFLNIERDVTSPILSTNSHYTIQSFQRFQVTALSCCILSNRDKELMTQTRQNSMNAELL
jgi:hypothetical protein